MAYWLFQANPKYYRIVTAIEELTEMPWPVTRYGKEMTVGDGVLIWVAGAGAGIYAIAQLTATPQIIEEIPDGKYWIEGQKNRSETPRAQLRFLRKLLGQPLRKQELLQDQILKTLLVIRAPNSTNFRVTPEQWERVHQLKG